MLKKCLLCFFVFISFNVFSAPAQDTTLHALSLLKQKKYSQAVELMELEILKKRDKETKGHYALLLHQLPLNIKMKEKRYWYAFLAARWAKNLPTKKRISLWVEAGDGFFKNGNLKKADHCYTQALSFLNSNIPDFAYILHKKGWIYINKKHWIKSFQYLTQALKNKKSRLRSIILADIGKIWVESQFFSNKISFSKLQKYTLTLPKKEQRRVANGIVQGINRVEKQDISPVLKTLTTHKRLSMYILKKVLSKNSLVSIESCQMVEWLKKSEIQKLPRESVISVLNSCVQDHTSEKKQKRYHRAQLKTVIDLYKKTGGINGIEHWPIALAYNRIGNEDEACNKMLELLTETIESASNDEIKKFTSESFRLCKRAKGKASLVTKAVRTLFSSDKIVRLYKKRNSEWEDTLFNFLNLEFFRKTVQENILKAQIEWKGKDLPASLVFSNIKNYSSEEILEFLKLFSPVPTRGRYFDIFIAGKQTLTTTYNLNKWLPLSKVNSYSQLLPYLKKILSDADNFSDKETVVEKLIEFFPKSKKDRRLASSFLALYFLKTKQTDKIFKHWQKLKTIFRKKKLAMELFEITLKSSNGCEDIQSSKAIKKIKHVSILRFTYDSCRLLKNDKAANKISLKIPKNLRYSYLAWDLVILSQTRRKTIRLKRGISQLNKRTSKMILNLKKELARYQTRKWRLNIVANQMQFFLKQQINLFEKELGRLAQSSPHGKKYEELRNIVVQWR